MATSGMVYDGNEAGWKRVVMVGDLEVNVLEVRRSHYKSSLP